MSEVKKEEIRVCKSCNQEKIRVRSHKVGKEWRFVDELGKLWMGRLCPACNLVKCAEGMRKTRANRS